MIVGRMVRIRFKRNYPEERLFVFVGKVLEFTDHWVMVEGKGLVVLKRAQLEVEIEEEARVVIVPRDNVAIIRLLPDNFDMRNIRTVNKGHKLCLLVDGAPDATIAEMNEV